MPVDLKLANSFMNLAAGSMTERAFYLAYLSIIEDNQNVTTCVAKVEVVTQQPIPLIINIVDEASTTGTLDATKARNFILN
jgi:hypothetical protein